MSSSDHCQRGDRGVFFRVTLALLFTSVVAATGNGQTKSPQVVDHDQGLFEAAKAWLLDPDADPDIRAGAVADLVRHNAKAAPEFLAVALSDLNPDVRREAAEYLARLEDQRGLEAQLKCLSEPDCYRRRHDAIRLLGNSVSTDYADPIAEVVAETFEKGLADGEWLGDEHERAILDHGLIAIARIGRAKDMEFVLRAAEVRRSLDSIEALGYVDDPKSRAFLWEEYQRRSSKISCLERSHSVLPLISLSRLGDGVAIQLLKGVLMSGGSTSVGQGSEGQSWCADREEAFMSLKPRDAKNFAETAFQIAAGEPEGRATIHAWRALGVMRPAGFGERVLRLALSKKPHWRLVSRQALHNTVIAIDPDLNDEFWRQLGVSPIPAYSGNRALVEAGLGRMVFSGTMFWTGD